VLKGKRGKNSINFYEFQNIIVNLSNLLFSIPEISEMDINPLIATGDSILAVDCRIKIEN
jgi:acetyltransferase